MAMLAVIVGAMLGGLMLPLLLSQNSSTRFDVERVHALHAAQTGVDVVLGQVRGSTSTGVDGTVTGEPRRLPCYSQSAPLTGVAQGDGNGRYRVSVAYWVDTPTAGGSAMRCAPGYGTYGTDLSGKPTSTPRFAVITSTGTDVKADTSVGGGKDRTLVSTYTFQTEDTNIPGGLIRLYPDTSGNQWCMAADKLVPDAGTAVVLRACSASTPPVAQQVFAYRSDLSIQLVSSAASTTTGLCVDTVDAQPTRHVSGVRMVLATCAADPNTCADPRRCSPYYQQWSVNDSAHLEGAKPDQSNTDGWCITAASQTNGAVLSLAGCDGSITSTRQTWVPSPDAGAGMADATNRQLVNYRQFATCLDVTGQDPNATYLILYTCKQNPDPSKVAWNQKFTPSVPLLETPTVTMLRTSVGATGYCMVSPLTPGGYVRLSPSCPTSAAVGNASSWTMYQAKGAGGTDLPYAQRYTIVDAAGRCLGPGPNADLYNTQYLKAVVSTCDGSTAQKWNATASLDSPTITNTHEERPPAR
jgi:hypothetical protein